MFYENFLLYCKLLNKTPSQIVVELNISPSSVTKWKNGTIPYQSTLQLLSDYFNITVEDLLTDSIIPYDKLILLFKDASEEQQHQILSILNYSEDAK